ncbi:MAG: sporulation membrane protein YtaF [Firmicutes bacterium]|nr:sporulation membrane protein YtaF [Bacillota bacterium]
MEFLGLFLLAFAVSLDGFAMGVTFGLRDMRLPPTSLLTIALASSVAVLFAMQAGHLLGNILSVQLTRNLGALILILVGAWVLLTTCRPPRQKGDTPGQVNLSFRAFGFVVQIIREPVRADLDKSGAISFGEALLLGLALALDALGAGFGASLAGYSPLWTSCLVGLFKIIMVTLGLQMGKKCVQYNQRLSYFSGGILILIGLVSLL